MSSALLDGETHNGSNPDLVDPINAALVEMDYLYSLGELTDSSVAVVEGSRLAEFMDRAERRCLENIYGNLCSVNLTIGPRREEFNQMSEQVDKAITRLNSKIASKYGDCAITGGVIQFDFQEKADDVL